MKRISLIIVVLANFLASCSSKHDQIIAKVEPIIKEIVVQDSLVKIVDSLIIYDLDTLTALNDSLSKIDVMLNILRQQNHLASSAMNLADLEVQSAKLSRQQAQLYLNGLNSQMLSDMQLEERDDHLNRSKAYLEDSNKARKLSQQWLDRVDNIQNLRDQKKLDSTTFKGYIARFRLKGADASNSAVKLDSMYMMFNPDLRLIKYSDINRR
jgi:hypothetical protein